VLSFLLQLLGSFPDDRENDAECSDRYKASVCTTRASTGVLAEDSLHKSHKVVRTSICTGLFGSFSSALALVRSQLKSCCHRHYGRQDGHVVRSVWRAMGLLKQSSTLWIRPVSITPSFKLPPSDRSKQYICWPSTAASISLQSLPDQPPQNKAHHIDRRI
jgi:hypothetical protein